MGLSGKILMSVAVVVLVVGGTAATTVVHLQRAAGVRQVELAAQTLTSVIYHGLESSMIRNNPHETQEIVRHLRGEPMVRRVDIFTTDGRIWSSSEPADVGTEKPRPELELALRRGEPVVRELPSTGELLALQPIFNRASCAPCHAGDPPILGAVSVSLDTRRLSSQVASSALWMAGLMALSVALALAILGLLVGRFLLKPLAILVTGVQQLASGRYEARVQWQSRDELGILAAAFNDMAERIQRYTAGLQREIGRLTRWLSNLRLFGRTLAEGQRLDAALSEVVEETARLVRADACRIALHDAPAGSRRVYAWGAEELLASGTEPRPLETGRPAPGAVDHPVCRAELPLAVKERRVGVLLAVRRGGNPFSPEDVTMLEAVASLVAIAVENVRLFDEVREKERLRGQLLGRIMGAQEDERRRIARELHDGVGQALTALMLHLDMALQSGEEVPQGTRQALEKLREVGEATLDEVRRITYDLRPAALDDLSLAAAVVWFARSRLEPAGIAVDAVVDACPERRLPPAAETAVFRIAQEALTNVLRHSGARHVRVRLSCPEGQPLELVVEDDGRGFDLHEVLGRRDHPALGLAGMRERAELLGGTLSIATAPGKGTRLEVRIDPAVLARLPEDSPVTEGG